MHIAHLNILNKILHSISNGNALNSTKVTAYKTSEEVNQSKNTTDTNQLNPNDNATKDIKKETRPPDNKECD